MRCDRDDFTCVCRAEFYTTTALHSHQAGCAIAAEHEDDAVRALEDRDWVAGGFHVLPWVPDAPVAVPGCLQGAGQLASRSVIAAEQDTDRDVCDPHGIPRPPSSWQPAERSKP